MTRNIKRALLKKGFHLRNSHHLEFRLFLNGNPQNIHTFISHGLQEYGDSLLAAMSRQLHLSKAELLEFIDCTMSGEAYLALLRERAHIA
ncbi:MAG: hypothetical protein H7A35_00475 [Planctomycetales bacterium]|nr:hypothetical protein [bacterium]UNM08538.1 MAG: hypothetical protein H7A35_00475 [Planctomycetales bacterium]